MSWNTRLVAIARPNGMPISMRREEAQDTARERWYQLYQ